VAVDHRRVRKLLFELKNLRATTLHALDERVAPFVMFGEQEIEVRRKAFAEPHVVPIALGDAVAEPLVCDLVDDWTAPAGDFLFAVKDRGGGLHAAVRAGRLAV